MKEYKKIASISLFKNQGGKVIAGNSGWTPYVGGSPGDILLSKDKKYQISVFQNDNGSQSIAISEIIDRYSGVEFDKVSDSVSQPAMKSIAEALENKKEKKSDDDDEIPF